MYLFLKRFMDTTLSATARRLLAGGHDAFCFQRTIGVYAG